MGTTRGESWSRHGLKLLFSKPVPSRRGRRSTALENREINRADQMASRQCPFTGHTTGAPHGRTTFLHPPLPAIRPGRNHSLTNPIGARTDQRGFDPIRNYLYCYMAAPDKRQVARQASSLLVACKRRSRANAQLHLPGPRLKDCYRRARGNCRRILPGQTVRRFRSNRPTIGMASSEKAAGSGSGVPPLIRVVVWTPPVV